MAQFIKIKENVDTTLLLAELAEMQEVWRIDTSRQRKVRCQRNTQNIFLRAPKKPLPVGAKNANDVHQSRLTPVAMKFPHTLAFCNNVADMQNGLLGRVTLVALLPRSQVYPHVDSGEYYRIRDRFHLVLKSPEGSPLTAEDETVTMRERELWVFNNKVRHWAYNPSENPRVHLIFDLLPTPGHGYYALP